MDKLRRAWEWRWPSTLHQSQKVIGIFGIVYFRSTPHPVTVPTRIITFLVGNPYKPSFATVTGWGVDPMYITYMNHIMSH